jgi:hypothetical protein
MLRVRNFSRSLNVLNAKPGSYFSDVLCIQKTFKVIKPLYGRSQVVKLPQSRRTFLRAGSTLIALPFLESIGFRRFAAASAAVAPPKRMVFLGFGYGVTQETWYPDLKQRGANFTLPDGLAPLARHRAEFTIVQGLTNKYTEEAHWGSTFWLTGANRFEGGAGFHNSVSVDQVAAGVLGKETRFASLQLNGTDPDITGNGHGPGLSLAWDIRGKPLAGLNKPLAAYHRLFSSDTTPIDERRAMLVQKRSVLDAVLDDAHDLKRKLGKNDNAKLDEYFEGIRDIEAALIKDEEWQKIPKPAAQLTAPSSSLAGVEEVKLMYSLIVAALQTDCTRVITYRQPISSLLASLGIKVAPHDMSHYSAGERIEASQKRDLVQSELLAGLIDKLKATKEADGTRLFDHTCLAFGSNIRSVHYLDNCPTLLTGGGAGVKLGQHVVVSKDTPLCNAWLTLLHGLGIKASRHGDSTGVISELMA